LENKKKKQVEGTLPSVTYLKDDGLGSLSAMMYKYPEKFAHIRQNSYKGTLEQWVSYAEKLEKKYGKLPIQSWLAINARPGVNRVMLEHPEMFARIQREEKRKKTLDEWLEIAEKLEKKYGEVPGPSILEQIGCRSLFSYMLIHKEPFAHIKRYQRFTGTEELVLVAEELEKEYELLPSNTWLSENGHKEIVSRKQSNPEAFAHIAQDMRTKSISQWVKYAEELAKKYGKLPNNTWLKDNRESTLTTYLIKYPEKFAHIDKVKKINTVDEWVKIAERLEKEHGELPGCAWLIRNKYSGLYACLKSNPEKFSHIKKAEKKQIKTVSEWVVFAEEMVKENGVISHSRELQRKYPGLDAAMRAYPEKFKEYPQVSKATTWQKWVQIAEKLAEKYDGLPGYTWLKENNYGGLNSPIYRHPLRFAHIKRQITDKRGRRKVELIGK